MLRFSGVLWLLAGISGTVFATGVASVFSEPELPEVLQGLPTLTSEIGPEWGRRAKSAFPIGTKEDDLIATLSKWGFLFDKAKDGRLWARYETKPMVCAESFFLEWTSDAEDRIVDISPDHHLSCL